MEQLTKEEILNESIEYVKQNGRAINDQQCVYNPSTYANTDHDGCLVGRCLDKRKYKRDMEGVGVSAFDRQLDVELDDVLKKRYKGHEEEFWARMQSLHDHSENWEVSNKDNQLLKLTEEGKEYVEIIKERFINAKKSF